MEEMSPNVGSGGVKVAQQSSAPRLVFGTVNSIMITCVTQPESLPKLEITLGQQVASFKEMPFKIPSPVMLVMDIVSTPECFRTLLTNLADRRQTPAKMTQNQGQAQAKD